MNGYKDFTAAEHLVGSAPKDEVFNPYDYIDQSHYRNTSRGRMAYQEDLAKLLYMAQINQEKRMNDYNSEQSQVERQKLAGLNPDLNGVQSNPAANVAGYSGNPMDGTQSSLQNVSSVVGIVSDVTSFISQIITGVDSFLNPSSVLDIASDSMKLFEKASPTFDFTDFINNSRLSSRNKRKINNLFQRYSNSADYGFKTNQFEIDSIKQSSENLRSNAEYYKLLSDSRYNPRGFTHNDIEAEAYSKAWKPFIDAEVELQLSQLKSLLSKSEYDRTFYSASHGENDRSFQKSTQDFEKARRELWNHLRGPINETLKNFDKLDYEWAPFAKAGFTTFLLSKLGSSL